MRVRIGVIVVLFLCAFPTDIYAEPTLPGSQDSQTKASFDLAVHKSMVLKLGKSRLETKSAFVTYTNEFFAGKTNALKASSRDEWTKYFSDYHFDRSRLRLKSRGTYNTAPDSKDDGLTLSWDTNLDVRVFDQIKK